MTLDTILQAAKNSMLRGHHKPHCFSAWVKGEGYINNGKPPFNRADYLLQLDRRVTSEIENMGWADSYAEPGYDKPLKGILFANWNCFPRDLDGILEKLGYATEWSDEWFVCDCNRAVRIQPDSYGWQPGYKIINEEILCLKCAK